MSGHVRADQGPDGHGHYPIGVSCLSGLVPFCSSFVPSSEAFQQAQSDKKQWDNRCFSSPGRVSPVSWFGPDPYACSKDVLERLPTQPARDIYEFLPQRWRQNR
jgi:hypothetical protein